jgi:pimeloyl-ACP methyl ester carboxylesterase
MNATRITERIDSGKGRPVIFVHAALLDGTQWSEVVVRAPPGVRAIAIDLPDVAFDAPGTTLASLEAAFDAYLVRHAIEPVTLVGTSLGAWLVARALSRAADRVRRAVLISGLDHLPAETAAAYEQLANGLETGAVAREAPLASIVDLSLGSSVTVAQRQAVSAKLDSVPTPRIVRTLRLVASLGAPEARVKMFSTPTALLHARNDKSVPLELGQALAALGNAPFEVLDSDSHVLSLTHPDRVAELAYA